MKATFEDFGPCWDQSGVRGFFGEGYWFHDLWSLFGLDLRGSTFVAKTTTLNPRKGNMELQKYNGFGWRPLRWIPDCIVVKPMKGVVLNAVGLSGPGAEALFNSYAWDSRTRPFMLSFMSVEPTHSERLKEAWGFAELLQRRRMYIRAKLGLQLNLSCPNVGASPKPEETFVKESIDLIEILAVEDIPIFPKFSVTTSPTAVARISAHKAVGGVVVSNTVPWGALPGEIDWAGLFDVKLTCTEDGTVGLRSPLAHLGGGGLSGAPLLPLTADWVRAYKLFGGQAKVAAGGGILCEKDVDTLHKAGADAICVGSAAILRPWRVGAIVRRAHILFGHKESPQ